MKLNLNKARKLEKRLGSIIDKGVSPLFKFSKYTDIEDLSTAYINNDSMLITLLAELEDLIIIRYEIRKQISDKNNTSGISDLLNSKNELTSKMVLYNKLIFDIEPYIEVGLYNLQTIKSKILDIRDNDKSYEYHVDYITSNSDDMNYNKKEVHAIVRLISGIDDKISVLNDTTYIKLSDDNSELFDKLNIIY